MQLASTVAGFRLRQFLSLTKPRVVSLIVFCDTTRGLVRQIGRAHV